MDDDKNKPRCFCYSNAWGGACENLVPDDSLGFIGGVLVLVVLLLVGLLAAAVWIYFKVARLRRRKLYQLDDVDEGSNTVFSIDDAGDL